MCIVEKENGLYFVLFLGNQIEGLEFNMRSYVYRLRAAVTQVSYTTISSSIICGGIQNSKAVYEETLKFVDRVFLMGNGRDTQVEEIEPKPFNSPLPHEFDMKTIVHTLTSFNKRKNTRMLDRHNEEHSTEYTQFLFVYQHDSRIHLQ